MFCKGLLQENRPDKDRQCDSNDIHKQHGRHPVLPTVSTGTFHMGVVSRWGDISSSRTPPREGEHNSRSGVKNDQGSMQLDAEPICFQPSQIQIQMGLCNVDLFASSLSKQLPRFYSWRPDPEAEKMDAFSQDWSQIRGYANPSWCLISHCLARLRRQNARVILVAPL